MKCIMSLETDYTTVPGQVFACISIVGPECPQKNDKFGIKLRGAFATRDEAANHAKRLAKINLCMAGPMRLRDEDFLGAPLLFTHVIRNGSQAARVSMFVS